MIRRSFRIGLWLGLIAGLTAAVVKLVQARQAPPEPVFGRVPTEPTRPWPRLEEPATAAPAPPTEVSPVSEIDLAPLPEPEPDLLPDPEPEPVVRSWVDPEGRVCPTAYPVKAKLTSKIFQVPGMFAYDRTNPDRCYRDAAAAEQDGFRSAKR